MISIVVCSINTELFDMFSANVKETIGLPFEIIRIDNSLNEYSICSAYNKGAELARFDVICFCHEDIIMHTCDWGSIVLDIFEANPSVGLIGISGSKYKAFAPSGWGSIPSSRYVNLIQRYKYRQPQSAHDRQNPDNAHLPRVVAVDGVFMCTKKDIALENRFDDNTFTGFHCYDLDFCFNLLGKHEVVVTFDILLEHFSEGRNDADWIINTMKFHEKWKTMLPVNISQIDQRTIRKYEVRGVKHFMSRMISADFSNAAILKMLHYNEDNPYIYSWQLKLFKIRLVKRFLRLPRRKAR